MHTRINEISWVWEAICWAPFELGFLLGKIIRENGLTTGEWMIRGLFEMCKAFWFACLLECELLMWWRLGNLFLSFKVAGLVFPIGLLLFTMLVYRENSVCESLLICLFLCLSTWMSLIAFLAYFQILGSRVDFILIYSNYFRFIRIP